MSDWKSSSPRWFKAGERRQELLIVSAVHRWESHWDANIQRSRRCGGRNCYACQVGSPRIARFVCIAVDDRGTDWLVEFRPRHEAVLEQMQSGKDSAAGCRICIKKEGSAKNSAVSIVLLGREYALCRDITRLVETLGEAALLVRESTNINDERATASHLLESGGEAAHFSE